MLTYLYTGLIKRRETIEFFLLRVYPHVCILNMVCIDNVSQMIMNNSTFCLIFLSATLVLAL